MDHPQSAIDDLLRRCPLFSAWPADRLRELAASARRRHYPHRTILAPRRHPLQEIYLVEAGAVEATTVNAVGDEHLFMVLRSGQVMGLVQLYEEPGAFKPRFYEQWARAGSTIIHLRSSVLTRILDEEPLLWKSLAQFMLRRFHLNLVTLQSQAIGSMRRRLAMQLVVLAQHSGFTEPDECHTELNTTQTDLALMLGTSRQTVSKELTRMKAEGVVVSEGYSRVTLLDWPRLLQIADEP